MSASNVNQNYLKAGEISREIKRSVEARNWEGRSYLEICDFVEGEARRLGGQPAFPCNVCANETAAHYTADIDDPTIVPSSALLKVDVGVHVEGFIADTAVTLCYDESLLDLTEATKAALNEALKVVKSGARTSDVGKVVDSYARKRGYLPIANLSGHALEQYVVHAGTSVPNVWSPSTASFKQDKSYAIEPFLTTREGSGIVIEGKSQNIYSLVARKNTKEGDLNDFLEAVWKKCRSLPFTIRWFQDEFAKDKLKGIVNRLINMKLIRSYPVLVEAKNCPVAQAEHTLAVTSTGFVILT